MEKAGQLLARTSRMFFGLNGANTNPEMQKMQREMAPKLSAHADAITLDPALFARVKALYDKRDKLGLDAESKRLLERYHMDFVRAGAHALRCRQGASSRRSTPSWRRSRPPSTRTCSRKPMPRRSSSTTRGELAGLSDAQIAAAADAAKARGHEGKYLCG